MIVLVTIVLIITTLYHEFGYPFHLDNNNNPSPLPSIDDINNFPPKDPPRIHCHALESHYLHLDNHISSLLIMRRQRRYSCGAMHTQKPKFPFTINWESAFFFAVVLS